MDDLLFFTGDQVTIPPPTGGTPPAAEIEVNSLIIEDFQEAGSEQNTPSVLWVDGKSYMTAIEPRVNRHVPILIQYDPSTDIASHILIGSGTDSVDVANHPRPAIWVIGNEFYIVRVNTHLDPIEIFKADQGKADPMAGFTSTGTIPGRHAYPQIFNYNNLPHIMTRSHELTPFAHHLLMPDAQGMEGTFTLIELSKTDYGNTEVRHYNRKTIEYGTVTRHWFAGSLRPDNFKEVNKYYANIAYYSPLGDFTSVTSFDGNFTKDIATNGGITHAEMEANCIINGRFENGSWDQLFKARFMHSIAVDDVFYGLTTTDGVNEKSIIKITPQGVKTVHPIVVNNLHNFDDIWNDRIRWNGSNLVLCLETKIAGKRYNEIWSCTMDMTNFKFHARFPWTEQLFLPENLDTITGTYAFIIGGTDGILTYGVTADKFLN